MNSRPGRIAPGKSQRVPVPSLLVREADAFWARGRVDGRSGGVRVSEGARGDYFPCFFFHSSYSGCASSVSG